MVKKREYRSVSGFLEESFDRRRAVVFVQPYSDSEELSEAIENAKKCRNNGHRNTWVEEKGKPAHRGHGKIISLENE